METCAPRSLSSCHSLMIDLKLYKIEKEMERVNGVSLLQNE